MSSNLKSVLADLRPQGFHGRGDKYLGQLAQGLRRVLWKTRQGFTYPACRLPETAWGEIAGLLVEWAEDIHNDIGLWRTVEAHQGQCFGLHLVVGVGAETELPLELRVRPAWGNRRHEGRGPEPLRNRPVSFCSVADPGSGILSPRE